MPSPRTILLALSLCGCVDTTIVKLAHVQAPLPPRTPELGWKAELRALFAHYDEKPVLTPRDPHLEPVFGGLTTLSYYGADVSSRVRDQQIPSQDHAQGGTLEAVCQSAPACTACLRPEVAGLPALTPVWVPLAVRGGPVPEAARCDGAGHPTGDGSADTFCMFARLALQPEGARPLIVVVHGLFDSGAQEYVQRMAAVLYHQGHSVLIPDMRDHGDTFRANPTLATTLGTLEGRDLLALVATTRAACAGRITRAGVAGVSGGGLDAMRAFAEDEQDTLSAGVIALSPLLDVNAAIRDVTDPRRCFAARSVELTWKDELAMSAISGGAFFAGASVARGIEGRPPDARSALSGGIGAALGLLGALAIDAWFDGGSAPCIAESSIARILAQVVSVRWQALRTCAAGTTMSAEGQRIDPDEISLEGYVHERAEYLASRAGFTLRRFDADSLSAGLHAALASGRRPDARMLVLGAHDDPLTREPAFTEFAARTRDLAQLHVESVRHGGHGAMWVVQPAAMDAVFARFFAE